MDWIVFPEGLEDKPALPQFLGASPVHQPPAYPDGHTCTGGAGAGTGCATPNQVDISQIQGVGGVVVMLKVE